jgi:hypothetical protein
LYAGGLGEAKEGYQGCTKEAKKDSFHDFRLSVFYRFLFFKKLIVSFLFVKNRNFYSFFRELLRCILSLDQFRTKVQLAGTKSQEL